MVRLVDNALLNIEQPKQRRIDSGGGAFPLRREAVEDWAWFGDAFTPLELDAIINLGNATDLEPGTTGIGQHDNIRKSHVSFLFPNEHTTWVFERLAAVITEVNARFFGFDLSGFEQGIQFTRYTAPADHYEWHVDRGLRNVGVRKLSLSVQLNDPAEYEGGRLQLRYGKEPTEPPAQRGMTTLFPSYVLHRVTPVTAGTRYSLVAWISGPPFK